MKRSYFILTIALILLITVTSALSEPVKKQISYSKTTTLAYPKTYTLKFSLWNDQTEGIEVWSEEKIIDLTSNLIQTDLGDTVSLEPSLFSDQLWVQVERKKADGKYVTIGKRNMLKTVAYSLWAPIVPTVLMNQENPVSLNVPDFWPSSSPICKVGPYIAEANKKALIDGMIQYIDDTANAVRLVAAYSTDDGSTWSTPNTHVVYASNVAGAWSCPAYTMDSLDLVAGTTYIFAVMYDESGGMSFTTQSALCRMRVTILDR